MKPAYKNVLKLSNIENLSYEEKIQKARQHARRNFSVNPKNRDKLELANENVSKMVNLLQENNLLKQ